MVGAFSTVGRVTEMRLTCLRNLLDVGTDPAHDYSSRIQRSHNLAKNNVDKLRKKPTPDESDAGDISGGMAGPLAELQEALGLANQEERDEQKGPKERTGREVPGVAAKARAQCKLKNTSAFVNQSYRDMEVHELKRKDVFPTSAQYRVKEVLSQPRLLIPDMSIKPKNIGLKTKAAMDEQERLKAEGKFEEANDLFRHSVSLDHLPEAPIREGSRCLTYKWLGSGHVPPEKMAKLVFNVNSFDDGVLDAINNSFERRALPNFDHYNGHTSLESQSFFQPGQYKCRFNAVRRRDDNAGPAWSAGPVGKPFKKEKLESFVPDRSLCRSCPFIEPRLIIPDLSKQTSRPDPVKGNERTSDVAFKPENKEDVYKHQMEFDADKADRFTLKRHAISNFRKSLRREQSIVGTRAFGSDRALQNAHHVQDIVSVETLPLDRIDSPLVVPRRGVGIESFSRNRGRSLGPTSKKEPDLPRFMREYKRGEARCDVGMLSPLSNQVVNMRRARQYSPMKNEE